MEITVRGEREHVGTQGHDWNGYEYTARRLQDSEPRGTGSDSIS